jgi:hypothetical protein
MTEPAHAEWLLLNYRLPREPSTPRIAVWRRLNELGVAKLGDGLVALPNDARAKEHLEWVAASVLEADGEAIVWSANTVGRRYGEAIARELRGARNDEYRSLIEDIEQSDTFDLRTVQRWRKRWRSTDRRDYFRAPLRDEARRAIAAAAALVEAGEPSEEAEL